MRVKWDTVVTTVLALCALVVTVLMIRHEFFPSPPPTMGPPEAKPVFIANWRAHLSKGEHIGPVAAPVQIIEFADFECPFCASFHKRLEVLRKRYPTQVALTYVHFPLPMHRFAVPAARAAECADAQGRFQAMHNQLFDEQDELGLKPWKEMAKEAGVPDLVAFEACVKSEEPVPRIAQGQQLGTELDITATPTVIVNGWKLGRPPTEAELDEMVKAVLRGKSPIT